MIEILTACQPSHFQAAALLFKEYEKAIGIDLGFQHFEEELSELQKMYLKPDGALLLACDQHTYIGCIGLRKFDKHIGELKRMFVQPTYQNSKIGQLLLSAAIQAAVSAKYTVLRLDTLESMLPAIHLYKKFGFVETAAYYNNPLPDVKYFEKILVG